MLQYFIGNKYKSIFSKGLMPRLRYSCMVDESSSQMPRSMHMHKDMIEILLVYEGTGIYIIGDGKYTAKKGDIIFYNSNVVHDEFGGLGTGLATYCLGISNLHLNGMEPNKIISDKYHPIVSSKEHFSEFLNMMELIQNNIENKNMIEFCNTIAKGFIIKACSLIDENCITKETKEHSLAIKIKAFIDEHYKESISLEKIAQAVNINRYYLSHVFKTTIGFSPMQYVTRRRIGEAQNLLINTDMSITQIAASLGYNNSNYFQNVFRQNVGLTPGTYRKKWKF